MQKKGSFDEIEKSAKIKKGEVRNETLSGTLTLLGVIAPSLQVQVELSVKRLNEEHVSVMLFDFLGAIAPRTGPEQCLKVAK